jgi:hypothetical protein
MQALCAGVVGMLPVLSRCRKFIMAKFKLSGFFLHRVWKKDDYWCQDQCKCYEMGQRRLSLLFMLSQVLSGLYQWNPSAKYGFLIDRILLIYMSMRLNYFVSRNSDNHLIIMYFSKWWMGELGILVSVSSNMWYKLAV